MKTIRIALLILVVLVAVSSIASMIYEEEGIVFYAGTRDGVMRITPDATELFSTVNNSYLSVWGNRLYDSCNEYSFEGEEMSCRRLGTSWIHVAGFNKLVYIDNEEDVVYFYDIDGNCLAEYGMLHERDTRLQNTRGLFLDESTFILATNGKDTVLKYCLQSGEITPIASSPSGWLGAIDYDRESSTFYIASGARILRFKEFGEMELVAEDLAGNVTGIVVIGNMIYFVSNFGNGLYALDMTTGETRFLTYLNYPQSLVAFPW